MERADLEQWKAREVARLLALVETERRYYQEIVATVPVGLVVLNRDLTILSANRAFRQTFGLRSQDVLRRQLEEVLPVEGLRAEVLEVLDSGKEQANRFFDLVREGETRRLRVGLQRIRSWSDEGEEEVMLSVEDFTALEPKPAPPAPDLREEVPAIVWEADGVSFEFTYVNRAGELLLGYPAAEWTEAGFWSRRIHPEDREWVTAFYRRAAASGDSHRCEYRAVKADGRPVWLRDIVRVTRDEAGQAAKLSGVSVDITERRRVEEQALEAQKHEALTRVMGKAAHGFNNLLMIIDGYGDQLLSGLGPDDPLRADIEEILRASERVSSVSAQLQSFTRRPAARPQTLDVVELVKTLEPGLREALPKNVAANFQAEGKLMVKADPEQLGQVIRSFLQQSVAGLGEGGNLIIQARQMDLGEDYSVPRSTLRPGAHAAIRILSDGRGLDEETRKRIFEPAFGQKSEAGLPVASAYGLLRQNGGDVMVDHAEFCLLLPLAVEGERKEPETVKTAVAPEPQPVAKLEPLKTPAAAQVPAPPAPKPIEVKPIETKPILMAPLGPRPEPPQVRVAAPPPAAPAPVAQTVDNTVLVVEDEAGIRMLMRKILDRQGYNVIEATRGEEALQIVQGRKTPVKLLVTDLVMPQMSGRELAERLTKAQPTLKVLYVSGFTDDEAIRSGSLGPGSAFLQKPFTLGSLVEKVKEVLGSEQQQ